MMTNQEESVIRHRLYLMKYFDDDSAALPVIIQHYELLLAEIEELRSKGGLTGYAKPITTTAISTTKIQSR